MSLFRFWSFMMGYVNLVIEGKNVEKFVNMAVSRGIYLWDISKIGDNKLLVNARISSFRALRHISKRIGCHMRIRQKRGLPFILSQFKRRKMMVAGALICLCTLYLLSSVIWFVEVKGNKNIPSEQIIKLAKEQGIRPGKLKWGLNINKIQEQLSEKIEGTAWVGIEVKGTKATIEIAEKIMPPSEAELQPAHIVAKKMGMVKEILVLKGEQVVKEGDMVNVGQVLITGEIWPKEDPEPNESGNDADKKAKNKNKKINKPELVRAKGNVRARVWYEGYGETPIIESGQRKTGSSVSNSRIKIFGKEIILKGPRKVPYKMYSTQEKVKRIPQWRNIRIPVELINTTYYELENYRIEYGPDKAIKIAEAMALKKIQKKLPQQRKILKKKVEEIKTNDENLVRVKAMIETLEEIGTVELIKDKGDSN